MMLFFRSVTDTSNICDCGSQQITEPQNRQYLIVLLIEKSFCISFSHPKPEISVNVPNNDRLLCRFCRPITMKTSVSRSSINTFALFFLSLIFLTAGFFAVRPNGFYPNYYLERMFSAHTDSDGLTTAVIILLVLFVAASLLTIRYSYRVQRRLLAEKNAMRQTEKALQQSEARFRDLFENANDLIYTGDLQGNFTSLNKAGEIITGYSEAEFCRLSFADMVAPEHLENARRNFSVKVKHGTPTAYQLEIITKNGRRVSLDLSSRVVYRAGEAIGIQGSGRDVTDRRRAEENLRESEERYRVVTESASDAIITISPEQTILFVNAAAENIFGYAAAEMLGKPLAMLMPETTRVAHEARIKRYAGGERGVLRQSVEFPGRHKNGGEIPLEITFGETDSGGRRFFTAVIRDISRRKQIEIELQKNLSLLTSTFEATADAILVVDRENQIVTHNRRFVEMTRMPDDIIASKNHARSVEFMLDQLADPAAFIEKTKELNRRPENHSHDIIQFKDGRAYERYSHPQTLDGSIIGRVVSFRNITERRRAEDALRRSEAKYRKILETIEEGYYETDLAGDLTFNNSALADALRYDSADLQGLNFRQFLDRENVEQLKRVYRKVLVTRQPEKNLEYEVIRRDGTRMFAESSVTLICDENQKPIGFRGVVREVTERRRVEGILRQSEAHYRLLFERNPYPIWVYDSETLQFVAVNQSAVNHYGYTREEFLELTLKDVRPPEDVASFMKFLAAKITSEDEVFFACRHRKKDGTDIEVEVTAQSIEFAGRKCRLGLITDVTKRNRATAALLESESNFRKLLESMHEGLVRVSGSAAIEFVNDRFCEMTEYTREELLGKNCFELLFDEESRQALTTANRQRIEGIAGDYELSLRKKSGAEFRVLVGGAPIANADGAITGSIGVFTDITTRKRAEQQLLFDAFHDNLTGLANRALFMDHLRLTIMRGKNRPGNPYAVLFLDFDHFKVVNDSLGHAEGDELLKQIARRLESVTRTGDLVARFGGDEFVVLLGVMLKEEDAVEVVERILKSLEKPFILNGGEIYISASIGIAPSSAGHTCPQDMLRDADIAMYRAKSAGRAGYQVFDETMHRQAATRLQMQTEMRQGLERGEFALYYQPIINLKNGRLAGFEALVRWIHPQRGMVSPMEFIPAAEESNLILPLGQWILQESCRQLREWQIDNPAAGDLTVSVNLSGKQFLQSDLADQIAASLNAAELAPRNLKVEITESYLMENSEKAAEIMERLRETGIEISLDDFGTGYSSLSYLHRLPVDYLKIDRSFVSRMIGSKENSEIVYTIIKLAQNLKMKVIAEGIETVEQLEHLKSLHCEYGQGYYFSKPVEPAAAANFIAQNLNAAD